MWIVEEKSKDDQFLVDLSFEFSLFDKIWIIFDFVFNVNIIGLEFFMVFQDEFVGDLKVCSLFWFLLDEMKVKMWMLLDGFLEVEFFI